MSTLRLSFLIESVIEFTVTLSTLLENGDFNRGRVRIQTAVVVVFSTRTELTKQWRVFTRYPVNATENGDFNRGHKIFSNRTLKFD